MKTVFIDGKAGTTGLRIYERLGTRDDITLISLSDELRKDLKARREALNSADIVFLCLPDDAARESVSLLENKNTLVIDTSTAHRTDSNWAYGFPELSKAHEERIINSKRIAVPGCHASGFISLVYPLVEAGAISKDALLSCYSLTGYSGGGRKMIEEYEAEDRSALLGAPRVYGLNENHKHLKEMTYISGLSRAPLFSPVVADFYSGMLVTVPIFAKQLENGYDINKIIELYKNKYNGPIVNYCSDISNDGFISACAMSGLDSVKIGVCGNEDRILLTALYDNLGKGASGAAVECFNLVNGFPLTKGLCI